MIDGAKSIKVILKSGKEYEAEGFYVVDEMKDIAILKVSGYGLPTINLGNSDYLNVGDKISTIGNSNCGDDPNSINVFTDYAILRYLELLLN